MTKSRTNKIEQGSEMSAGQQMEAVWTETGRFESDEEKNVLYLAGADSSILIRSDI